MNYPNEASRCHQPTNEQTNFHICYCFVAVCVCWMIITRNDVWFLLGWKRRNKKKLKEQKSAGGSLFLFFFRRQKPENVKREREEKITSRLYIITLGSQQCRSLMDFLPLTHTHTLYSFLFDSVKWAKRISTQNEHWKSECFVTHNTRS